MQLKGLFMIVGPLEALDPSSDSYTLGASKLETQAFPSQLVEVCLAQWNEVYVGYSTDVWIEQTARQIIYSGP